MGFTLFWVPKLFYNSNAFFYFIFFPDHCIFVFLIGWPNTFCSF